MSERDEAGRFKPGQSGNPGGRPKESSEIAELARKYAPEAIERLVTLMKGKDARVAVQAAQVLLDRGYGRPPQAVDLTVERPVISADAIDAETWTMRHAMEFNDESPALEAPDDPH